MTALRLAAVFTDHMVLCRRKEIRLFGEADDGRHVTATLNGHTARATARDGRFLLALPPMEAGGPYELTVTDGETTLRFADVLVGDVYLAGGQSNMELELQNADNGKAVAATASNDSIRFYNTLKQPFWDEQADALERQTRWKAVSPGGCLDVSAVAYHFAVQMQAKLGVPVGIIDCYWGGTMAACWLDDATLRKTAEGQLYLAEYAAATAGKTDIDYDAENERFQANLDAWNAAVAKVRDEHPGIVWDDIAAIVGPCPWCPPMGRKSAFRPGGLVETMLKRVAPYTLTAILYYQAESDDIHPERYEALMHSVIWLWRRLFMEERLPFAFVQLPMYAEKSNSGNESWPMLRLTQERVHQALRDTAMIVLIDYGEFGNIHPTDKLTVGTRLYQQVLKLVYGEDLHADSPRVIAKRAEDDVLVLTTDAPVLCREGAPRLLEVAGADGRFAAAEATVAGCELRVCAGGVPEPTQARYAWVDYAVVNLFGENGMPLAPFWVK